MNNLFTEKEIDILKYVIDKNKEEYEKFAFINKFDIGQKLQTLREIPIQNGIITVGSDCYVRKISSELFDINPVIVYGIEFPDCPGKYNTLTFRQDELHLYFAIVENDKGEEKDFSALLCGSQIKCKSINNFTLIKDNGKSKTDIKELFLKNHCFVVGKSKSSLDLALLSGSIEENCEYFIIRVESLDYELIKESVKAKKTKLNIYYKQNLYGYIKESPATNFVYLLRYDVYSKGSKALFMTPSEEFYQKAIYIDEDIEISKHYDSAWDLSATMI